jgi:hypothetical protein
MFWGALLALWDDERLRQLVDVDDRHRAAKPSQR